MKLMDRLNLLAEAVAFTPLGILLGVMFGATSTFVVMRSLAPSLIQHPAAVAVTVLPEQTTVAVIEPTLPPPLPQATATPEPTARPKGANYTVKDGDNMINIVKHVCRDLLGYELWDQYYVADLAEMNRKHNEQYIGQVLQPDEEVGIGCVLP